MIHSVPKNKLKEVNMRDVFHARFKFAVSIVEIISNFRGILMVVHTQGHCWPQADFEDFFVRFMCVGVCVCVYSYWSVELLFLFTTSNTLSLTSSRIH